MIEKVLEVALVGPPNVGKSTLINAIVGQKIAITTHKPQTTRNTTLGIVTNQDTQIIFADTPGIFDPRPSYKLEKFIVNNATKTIKQSNVILLLVDAYLIYSIYNDIINGNETMDSRLSTYHTVSKLLTAQTIVIANKIDTIEFDWHHLDDKLFDIYNVLLKQHNIQTSIIPISALKNTNVEYLIDFIKSYAKEKSWKFDAECYTNISERELAEEVTREQLYLVMHDEIPYSVMVDTDSWIENSNGSTTIHQSIIVLKASQKNMIIGSNGRMIKIIGERARSHISHTLDREIHLFLHVKVRNDWIDMLSLK